MSAASPSRRLGRLVPILWVLVLWIPALQMVVRLFPERPSLAENRVKAPPPSFENGWLASLGAFPTAFEHYFNDGFGFRDALIAAYTSLLYRILRTSPTDNVALGNEGWLYYNSATDGVSLADYCGLKPFSRSELDAIERNLTLLTTYLRARGSLFAVLVAPNKHTIYPEHLPEKIQTLAGKSRLDQLAERLARRPDIIFVDPRRALIEGKSRNQLYLRTDSHWKGAGAFIAYWELMRGLGRAGAPIPVPAEKAYRRETGAAAARDLTLLLGVPNPEREADLWLTRLVAPRTRMTSLPVAAGEDPAHAPKVCETDHPERPRLVMFRDSFAEHMRPLMCSDFFRSAFFWRRGVDSATLDLERPSIVVLEVAERYLDVLQNLDTAALAPTSLATLPVASP